MEIIIVIAVLVAAYLIWGFLTKEVETPRDLVRTTKEDDDTTAYAAPYKVPEPAASTPIPMFVPPVAEPVAEPVAAPVAEPVAEKPKRKPAARTAAPKKPVAKAAPAKKTVAAKKPVAKKKSA